MCDLHLQVPICKLQSCPCACIFRCNFVILNVPDIKHDNPALHASSNSCFTTDHAIKPSLALSAERGAQRRERGARRRDCGADLFMKTLGSGGVDE
ncbi:hypothetical protein M8J76_009945 [Diaphorina citri]|nr:hypothetical protein M8J76_009945 [Diaphorina citri]